jgi:autotransporter translocation and assembly factor TamB
MRALRRILQVVALVGTLMVGVLAVALIVSQTPWFKDWLRRYVVRESKQYLNGELAIGGLGGNLLFGANLSDVAVDVSGERVVAVKSLELDYNVFQLISSGLVLNQIKIQDPVLHVERDANGWNLGRLVKKQEQEADRQGPGRPISLPSIEITGGSVSVNDGLASSAYTLPRRIDGLDVKASYEYAPVHYSVEVDHIRFRGTAPDLSLEQLTGKLAVRDDNLYLEQVKVKTPGTSLTIDGVVQNYLATPVLNLTTTGNVSLPEVARVVPAAAGYNLHPALNLRAEGPAERLALDMDVRSEAGAVKGRITADVQAPDFAARGTVAVERLNLAPILKDPAQRTDLTGQANLDVRMASNPADAPVTDRMSGTFDFSGPRVMAAGYEARDVRVKGSLDGSRITIDGRAAAYGGTATAKGSVVTSGPGRALAYDIRGAADNVDLRNLPATTGAPKLATDLSVAEFHVSGSGPSLNGTARLNASTIEGAKIAEGTTTEFGVTPATISYAARGNISDLNLTRMGSALDIPALAKPEYDSRVNGAFDVTGSQPRTAPRAGRKGGVEAGPSALATMKLDASATLTDSGIMGGRIPELALEAHLDQGALKARAAGNFEGFNPARVTGRKDLEGNVTGRVDANVAIANVAEPITPEAITADGTVGLTGSTVAGLKVDAVDLQGRYASQIGDITKFSVAGPDVKAEASGRLALDRTSESNVKYHVDALNLPALASLAGQKDVGGTATLDGTLTGNAASLKTAGTLDGSNLSYQNNKALDLNSRYSVTVADLDFARAQVQSTTEATFVAAGGLQINSITATTTYADQKIDFQTSIKEQTRELDAAGRVILHPDHQEVHLPSFAVRTQGVEWRSAQGSNATVKYSAGRVELENVKLVSGDQSLEVGGTLALGETDAEGTAPAAGAIKVNARNVDLQQLETLLLQNRGFTGKLTADATLAGSTADPAIDGHVEIHDGGFQKYRYQSFVADVDYAGTRAGIDATLQQSPTESIVARGTVPTSLFRRSEGTGHVAAAPGDEVDLQIKSTALGLGIIQGFTTMVTNVAGTLEADVRVTGSGEDPHLDGFIDIKNGAFGVPLGGVSYTGLNTRIELDPDKVRLQAFRILDEHGKPLSVSGELAVHARQVGGVNVSIESDDFELIDNELGDVGTDSRLKITGELRRPKVEGSVRVHRGRIEVDRVLEFFYDPYAVESLPEVVSAEQSVEGSGSAEEATRQALARAQTTTAPGAKEEPAPSETPAAGGVMDPLAMDVQLEIPDNLVLRGDDLRPGGPTGAAVGNLNITVGGALHARKEPGGQVTITGEVQTIRGTYEFQGRRFDLERGGTLRFTGSPKINPIIDITAVREIPNTGVVARVHVTGSADAPELQLTSEPPLDESDILALIVFNRPVNELGTGERSSLAATAGGIATGFIAEPLGKAIGRALDLDLFEVTTTTDQGDLGAGITVGQQIGDRAFVKLRQQFGRQSVTEFILEYRLYDFLRVQTTAAPQTVGSANRLNQRRIERAGIDLIFFFSY